MTDPRAESGSKPAQYEEVLRRFAAGVRAAQLYAREHSLVARNVDGLLAALARWRWSEGPLFVEAVFDPDRYAAMTRDVR